MKTDRMVPVLDHLDKKQADTYSLVLHSIGIQHNVHRKNNTFSVTVDESDVSEAIGAIWQYRIENPTTPQSPPFEKRRIFEIGLSGLFVSLVLFTIHAAVVTSGAPDDYITQFGANAQRIMSGEVYRCVTALLLHADAAHLIGNMVALMIFGGAVSQIAGVGVGWMMILTCGILGNLINAAFYGIGHLSIGASTGIFGAVGILCAVRAVDATRTGHGWKHVVFALGGGIALLAFLGASARSDMGAHLFGFLVGIGLGGVYGWWRNSPFAIGTQLLCGIVAAILPVMAWVWGAR